MDSEILNTEEKKSNNVEKNRKKNAKKRFTIRERASIVERIENGERQTDIAREFNVNRSTISTIFHRRDNTVKSTKALQVCNSNLTQIRFRRTESSQVELEVYEWFKQQKDAGLHVSGVNLQEKALELNEKYGSYKSFHATNGWLHKFKARWGIKLTSDKKQNISDNESPTERFRNELESFIDLNDINLNFIYNCDETKLFWKALPNKTLACPDEQYCAEMKKIEDQVTIMAATNASGNHKIPLFVTGKQEKSRYFRNIKHLPVNYTYSENACMDRALTMHWFRHIFLPEIRAKYDCDNNKSIRIILIMDDAHSHPPADVFNAVCDFCTVLFLPSNVASLIQPLEQGIIEQFKKYYKQLFMSKILVDASVDNVDNVIRSYTLLNCLKSCSRAWSKVTSNHIRNCWDNLIPLDNPVSYTDEEDLIDVTTFHSLLSAIPEYNSITFSDTINYFNSDNKQSSYENDEEIFNNNVRTFTTNYEITGSYIQDDISIKEALKGLNTFIKYYEREENCSLSTLRLLEDINQDMIDKIIMKVNI